MTEPELQSFVTSCGCSQTNHSGCPKFDRSAGPALRANYSAVLFDQRSGSRVNSRHGLIRTASNDWIVSRVNVSELVMTEK